MGGSSGYYLDIDLSKFQGSFDFNEFGYAIERGLENGKRELRDRLEKKLIEYMMDMGLGGSNLMANILVYEEGDGIVVTVGTDYAIFVEYGTGIVGSENPHPHPWEYDVNGHGEDGWKYKGDDGKIHWTAGQPSRPFMYKTWLWGTRSASQIIRKNIRAELKKIKGVKTK